MSNKLMSNGSTVKARRLAALACVVAVLATAAMISGCGSTASASKGGINLVHGGTLTIGTSNDAPLSFIVNGKPEGVLPDILRGIMKREGIATQLSAVAMPFASLIPAVQANKIDMVGDGMYVTPARSKEISFTSHSMYNPEGLVVAKGNPKHIHNLNPADLSGDTLATYEGTVWVQWLQDLKKANPKINVRLYPTIQGVIQDIGNGRVDAGVIDASITAYAIKKNPGLGVELVSSYTPKDKVADAIAFGVAKSNPKLLTAVNRGLAAMAADGATARILQHWGLTPASFYLQP